MSEVSLATVTALYRDMYPAPGDRIKQWVVDYRREAAWESETCPRVAVPEHKDNTGAECRNSSCSASWTYLDHDCCYVCNELQEATQDREDVQAWLAEKAKRPPVEQDRTKLSDEVQPNIMLESHPFLAMLPRLKP